MVLNHRLYKNKTSQKLYFTVASGMLNYKQKEQVCIFADVFTGKTILYPIKDFEKDFELVKQEECKNLNQSQ